MFEEVTILGYLNSPIPKLSSPAAEVLFILDVNPSPPVWEVVAISTSSSLNVLSFNLSNHDTLFKY